MLTDNIRDDSTHMENKSIRMRKEVKMHFTERHLRKVIV